LITGNAAGKINFIENIGGDPVQWAAPTPLLAEGEEIHIMAGYNGSIQGPAEEKWGYTVVDAADWNQDGLLDIIVNSIFGKVIWYENIGTTTNPKLTSSRPIEVEWNSEVPKPVWNWWNPQGKELVTQWRSSVQAVDINKDGLVDLVALDQEGFLSFYERSNHEDELLLLPPKRIFFVETDSVSVFDDDHNPMQFDAQNASLSAYADDGTLGYFGREWDGNRWGPYKIVKSVTQIQALQDAMIKRQGAKPLRLSGGWAGRSGRRKFVFADWNGDGRLDLIVNSYNANLLLNVSNVEGEFLFRDYGRLGDIRLAGHTSCPTVVNWYGGETPDLLIGAEDGYFYYLRNKNANGRSSIHKN
jgi:hypothetical protein